MYKVLYVSVYNIDPEILPFDGVMKKITLHIDAFKSYGNSVDYIETDGKKCFFVDQNSKTEIGNFVPGGYQYFNELMAATAKHVLRNNLHYDYIYIRQGPLTPKGFRALKQLYIHSNRIYMEIPTYYEPEKTIKNTIKYFFNKYLKKYVYKMVTDCDQKEIYGIETLMVINGTDLSKISTRLPTCDSTINVALVASISDYHGVNKIINAVDTYYSNGGNRDVLFHIVGTGPKLNDYISETKTRNLDNHIIFYGKQCGEKLDSIFNKCEIGISSLANKEIGVLFSSTLKSKEYLAKGIPIISDVMLDVFSTENKYYFYQLKNDFNLDELVSFYDSVYSGRDKQDIINEIREYANRTCDMYKVLQIVNDDYIDSMLEQNYK